MNSLEHYREAERCLAGSVSAAQTALSAIQRAKEAVPMTSHAIEPHLLQLKLQTAFMASALNRLRLIETKKAANGGGLI